LLIVFFFFDFHFIHLLDSSCYYFHLQSGHSLYICFFSFSPYEDPGILRLFQLSYYHSNRTLFSLLLFSIDRFQSQFADLWIRPFHHPCLQSCWTGMIGTILLHRLPYLETSWTFLLHQILLILRRSHHHYPRIQILPFTYQNLQMDHVIAFITSIAINLLI